MRYLLLSHSLSVVGGLIAYYRMRSLVDHVMTSMDKLQEGATAEQGPDAAHLSQRRLWHIARRLAARGYQMGELNVYEQRLLAEVVLPTDVKTRFADVGGQTRVVSQIQEHVVAPLRFPELFAHSHIAQRPTGVLLYGPPGCGKTLLARAMAHECRAAFLSISPSALEHKWVGDTPKAIAALFSLAAKMAPTIIFIDEIDGLLSARSDSEQSWSVGMKSALLQHWDGLGAATAPGTQRTRRPVRPQGAPPPALQLDGRPEEEDESDSPPAWVVVIGATNRPWALDEAALRRMPRQIEVPLPDSGGRADILRRMLTKERCDDSVEGSLRDVADATAGCSGSDLAEVVREAVQRPIREALHARLAAAREAELAGRAPVSPPPSPFGEEGAPVRALTADDLLHAANTVQPSTSIGRGGAGGSRSASGSDNNEAPDSHGQDYMAAMLRAMTMMASHTHGT